MNMMPTTKEVLNIKETLAKAQSLNYHITEYTLRRAIREGALPCRPARDGWRCPAGRGRNET